MTNVLFLHAHPDDEAIFTGGTIARLATEGHQVFVAFATNGELGIDRGIGKLDQVRIAEARQSCSILGARDVAFLGYQDSGYQTSDFDPHSFVECNLDEAARKLTHYIEGWKIDTLAFDDENGIYGHPDHKQSHRLGLHVAKHAQIDQCFTFTVDREYLHYLIKEAHVVSGAFEGFNFHEQEQNHPLNLDERFGSSTVEIDRVVEANGIQLLRKRQAMEAHASQMRELVTGLTHDQFHEAYRYEWFNRLRVFSPSGTDVFDSLQSL